MRNFQLINKSNHPLPRQFLKTWSRLIYKLLKKEKAKNLQILDQEITLVFLNRSAARKPNLNYRGKNYATDVLSFNLDSGGDIILCPQVLKRQALEHDLSFREELGYLVLHGFLHLMGYEHEGSPSKAKKMFKLQDQVFARAAKELKLSRSS